MSSGILIMSINKLLLMFFKGYRVILLIFKHSCKTLCKITWHNIPEDLNLQHCCCENLESHISFIINIESWSQHWICDTPCLSCTSMLSWQKWPWVASSKWLCDSSVHYCKLTWKIVEIIMSLRWLPSCGVHHNHAIAFKAFILKWKSYLTQMAVVILGMVIYITQWNFSFSWGDSKKIWGL